MTKRSNSPNKFLTQKESEKMKRCVEDAEKKTSAELKVILVRHCWGHIQEKAARLFRKFRLHETKNRNAVMIMLVLTDREFIIYGDEGVHEKVGQSFWDDMRNKMAACFREDKFCDGLCLGISLIGEKLAMHYPPEQEDRNEIADNVDFEK
jgi:uncharacterized membrane protein